MLSESPNDITDKHSFINSSRNVTKSNYLRLKNVSIEVFKSYPFDSNIEIQISSLAPVTDFILTTTFFCNSSRDDADFIVSQSSLRCNTLRSIFREKRNRNLKVGKEKEENRKEVRRKGECGTKRKLWGPIVSKSHRAWLQHKIVLYMD